MSPLNRLTGASRSEGEMKTRSRRGIVSNWMQSEQCSVYRALGETRSRLRVNLITSLTRFTFANAK